MVNMTTSAHTIRTTHDGLVVRVARKEWTCHGGGGRPERHAPDCVGTIHPGDRHIEVTWEAAAYQTGPRTCLPCAEILGYIDRGQGPLFGGHLPNPANPDHLGLALVMLGVPGEQTPVTERTDP